ncbi:MAG: hypothetical protein E7665_10055 [Ruminococcaceae bacterium]|nr:hypothetical protein [Oscillospiraceae bacterium]
MKKTSSRSRKFTLLLIVLCLSMLFTACTEAPVGTTGTQPLSSTEEKRPATMAGTATRSILPPDDIDMSGFTLCGFGNINRRFESVLDELEMGCTVFEINGAKSAIVVADVLGWDKDITEELRKKVENELGIPADSILFNASHTHSSFNTLTNTSGLGYPVQEYQDFFYETAFECIKAALEDLEEVEIYTGATDAKNVGISRRLINNGVCYWQPSEKDPRDDSTTVIKIMTGDKVKTVLFSFACHPSTLNGNQASADFVGHARNIIETKLPGATAMFIQGCGGDVKTRVVNSNMSGFRAGNQEDITTIGNRLGTSVLLLCNGKRSEMTKVEGTSDHEIVRFSLPLQENNLTKADYKRLRDTNTGVLIEVYNWFYENYENLPTEIPYSVQRIDLGDKFTIFALEGEVVSEYGGLFRALLPDRTVMVAGYSNGEIGYIPMEHMYEEGGYETDRSCDYYRIPKGFKPEIESIIMTNAKELLD